MTAAGPTRPAPVVTEESAAFWSAAREGRLVAQRCRSCGRLQHPPRPMCPTCHALDLAAEEVSGRGSVYSYALLHGPQNPAFTYPIVAALVDLEEGVRLVTNLVDVDPAAVTIGMEVEVAFEPTKDEGVVPVFRPRGAHP